MKLRLCLLASLALLLVTLTGCYPHYNYKKTVTNQTGANVTLQFACCGSGNLKTFEIAPGETEVIHECIYETLGKVPDCTNNPLDITLLTVGGTEMESEIRNPANWEQIVKDRSVTCNYVIQETVLPQ